mmetsp:Transcript_23489/g.60254  ORF Transcript_23489/g.60254 Transcript_23489/m.60254 type:complete len:101 (+) Transcript_23489:272-574(+)
MKLPVAVVLLLTIATATILPAFARRELQNDDSDDDGDRGRYDRQDVAGLIQEGNLGPQQLADIQDQPVRDVSDDPVLTNDEIVRPEQQQQPVIIDERTQG